MKILDLFNDTQLQNHAINLPYIIAEAGVNHEGSMDIAKLLIDQAAEGGAHAIKFQTYKANTIASKDSPAYWDLSKESTDSQYKLFKKYDKFWKAEFEDLKNYCDVAGIEFLSTPFDIESANFLNEMMDVFKISSSDITNKPFIEHLCNFGKPIILSTGASYLYEVQQAVEWIDSKQIPLALLHCILNYPTADEDANLAMIKDLKIKFPDKIVGYSDHTLPKEMQTLEIATILGSRILEKHFTHDKSLPGNDHYHAMDKNDLILFIDKIKKTISLLGGHNKKPLASEENSRNYARRSLVLKRKVNKGKVITSEDIICKRPGTGISPKYIAKVVGKITNKEIEEDALLQWNMLE